MKGNRFLQGCLVFIAVITLAVCFSLVMAFLVGCGSVKKASTSTQVETVAVSRKDTTFHKWDSSGIRFEKETIREYYHDTSRLVLQPYPVYREIIRESGQSSQVSSDSGRTATRDTTVQLIQMEANSKEREGLGWWDIAIMAGLSLIILKPLFSTFKITKNGTS